MKASRLSEGSAAIAAWAAYGLALVYAVDGLVGAQDLDQQGAPLLVGLGDAEVADLFVGAGLYGGFG